MIGCRTIFKYNCWFQYHVTLPVHVIYPYANLSFKNTFGKNHADRTSRAQLALTGGREYGDYGTRWATDCSRRRGASHPRKRQAGLEEQTREDVSLLRVLPRHHLPHIHPHSRGSGGFLHVYPVRSRVFCCAGNITLPAVTVVVRVIIQENLGCVSYIHKYIYI